MWPTGLMQTQPAPMHAILSLQGPVVHVGGQRLAALKCSGRVFVKVGCPAFEAVNLRLRLCYSVAERK